MLDYMYMKMELFIYKWVGASVLLAADMSSAPLFVLYFRVVSVVDIIVTLGCSPNLRRSAKISGKRL